MDELLLLFISTHSALGLHLAVQVMQRSSLNAPTYPLPHHHKWLIMTAEYTWNPDVQTILPSVFVHAPNVDSTLKILNWSYHPNYRYHYFKGIAWVHILYLPSCPLFSNQFGLLADRG